MKVLPHSVVQELLTPVLVVEEKGNLLTEEKRVEHLTTWAHIKEGRYLIKEAEKEVVELVIKTEKAVSKELIEAGSSFSIYPQNS